MIAAIQAAEAIKLLAGQASAVRRGLWQIDLWRGSSQSLVGAPHADCPCCQNHKFAYLRA
jgi:adenylyltransferase/sulfurtransferase